MEESTSKVGLTKESTIKENCSHVMNSLSYEVSWNMRGPSTNIIFEALSRKHVNGNDINASSDEDVSNEQFKVIP